MILLLAALLLQSALMQSHGELLTEPSDQEVVLGRSATFHCNTISLKAYWRVNSTSFNFVGRYSHFQHYHYSSSSDGVFFNISLKIDTSEAVDKLTVRCFYAESSHIHPSRIAHLTTFSCLALPEENLEILAATFYYNVEETLAKILFELPESCENISVNYTILAEEDMNGAVISVGPIQHKGHWRVEEEISSSLNINQLYSIQVEAAMIEPMERVSQKWTLDTHIISNLTCTKPNQSTVFLKMSHPYTGQLTVVVSSTGAALLLILLFITAVCLGAVACTWRKQKRRQRHHQEQSFSNCMVPNPIYDGPMYESIHQQFSKVALSSSCDCVVPSSVSSSCRGTDPSKHYENTNISETLKLNLGDLELLTPVLCPSMSSPDSELSISVLSSKPSEEQNRKPCSCTSTERHTLTFCKN